MSTKDINTKIPKYIGTNQLVETFGKLNLSSDVKDFLTAIGGKIVATYSAGAEKPELEILDRKGHTVCSIDEFVKLGGFRRWVNDELKQIEKETAGNEKVQLLAYFVRRAKADATFALPDRMEEGNETRFKDFNAMIKVVRFNLDKIHQTKDDVWKTYLMEKGLLLVRVLHKLMYNCLRAEKMEKEALNASLFENGVPKWLQNRLVDKSFTANLRDACVTVLFPRGNYTRSIALTLYEIKSQDFLAANIRITAGSGSIFMIAKHDHESYLPKVPEPLAADFEQFLENHMWVLNNPYTWEEILEYRCAGKSIPVFKARQRPIVDGKKIRPETEIQQLKREAFNTLGLMNVTWLAMQNLVIPCENPRENFWTLITGETQTWNITPTNNLYQNLKAFGTDLSRIRSLSDAAICRIMGNIMVGVMRVPTTSEHGKTLMTFFKSFKDKAEFSPDAGSGVHDIEGRLDVDLAAMENTVVTDTQFSDAKLFVDKPTNVSSKQNRGGGSTVRLSTEVLDELSIIKDHPLYPKVKNWLASSFKTRSKKMLQITAAQRIAGEVLENQGTLLAVDFNEYEYLESLERINEEDDD